jgi:cytochrome c553
MRLRTVAAALAVALTTGAAGGVLAAAEQAAGVPAGGAPGATGAAQPGPTLNRIVEGDAALGEYLSGECVTCHQITGNYDGIPSIVGWPAVWFVEAMNEFRAKRRANPVMQTIAGRYSDDEIAALAVYFEKTAKHPPR